MADEIVETLEREEAKLLDRLARIQAAKAAYLGTPVSVSLASRAIHHVAPHSLVGQAVIGKLTVSRGRRKEIEDTVANYLDGKGARAPSGELYDVVVRAGIDIGGATPSKSLASTLSTSDRFNNIKGLGYGLAEWGESPGPKAQKDEAPTSVPEGASQVTEEAGASSKGQSDDGLFG